MITLAYMVYNLRRDVVTVRHWRKDFDIFDFEPRESVYQLPSLRGKRRELHVLLY